MALALFLSVPPLITVRDQKPLYLALNQMSGFSSHTHHRREVVPSNVGKVTVFQFVPVIIAGSHHNCRNCLFYSALPAVHMCGFWSLFSLSWSELQPND